MNKFLLAVVVVALSACGVNVPPSGPGPGETPYDPWLPPSGVAPSKPQEGVVRQAQLIAYPACTDLESAVKARLLTAMNANLARDLKTALTYYQGGYGYGGWWGADAGVSGVGGGTGGGSGGTGGGAGGGPTDVTGTNVQVAGVDEPDIIKNDGNRIFVLSRGKLMATRSWPASDLALQGSFPIPGTAREMFLDGDTVVVFSTQYQNGGYSTLATLLDVSNLASLKMAGQYTVPGSYRSARRIGPSVRVVTSGGIGWPTGVVPYFSYWGRTWKSETEIINAFTDVMTANEKAIRGASLRQLLPLAKWQQGAQKAEFDLDCGAVHLSTGVTALGFSEVSTFKTDVPAQLARQLIYEIADEVYADSDSLYFTSRHWWWNPSGPGDRDATYIHKFDTTSPTAAKYVATGVIDGYLTDQFAMDEWNGNLRLAATVQERAPTWGTWNEVVVLGQVGARLVELGKSAKLAQGERITSARFFGDVGYVVTFRQTDPLFVFDLKDPSKPKKIGELKVPGFSSYIHPLDATHLLTIGTYVPETGGFQSRAVQLAIFDVSDLTNPKQTHLQLLGNFSASSDAQSNHKAFNYFPAKKLLAVPLHEWSSGQGGPTGYWYQLKSELHVYGVDAAAGFTARGTMSMADLSTQHSYYAYDEVIRRSVMADDFVYAISDVGIRVANVNALQTPLATAKF